MSRMADPIEHHEVFALHYATMYGRRASELYVGYEAYGIEDRFLDMACYFWVIRSGSRVMLVDCGWNRDRGLGGGRYSRMRIDERDPIELLARLDVDPSAVDHIVVSHMHIDHIGNLDLFPRATVSVARAEFDCWTGPYARHPALGHSTSAQDVRVLQQLADAGRVQFIDGPQQLVRGITVTPVGGHSPGQLIIDVQTPAGTVVLASDAVHYHEEIEHNRPFYIYTDIMAMFRAYELLRERASRPNTWFVTGHDPVEMERFHRLHDGCVNLAKPLS
jgi:glyoxylase-like metal-dependent hydrolase (beta-lactamase superfamily II)